MVSVASPTGFCYKHHAVTCLSNECRAKLLLSSTLKCPTPSWSTVREGGTPPQSRQGRALLLRLRHYLTEPPALSALPSSLNPYPHHFDRTRAQHMPRKGRDVRAASKGASSGLAPPASCGRRFTAVFYCILYRTQLYFARLDYTILCYAMLYYNTTLCTAMLC